MEEKVIEEEGGREGGREGGSCCHCADIEHGQEMAN
jgi:hypothetical protein